jgi:hypothetical protein
VIDRPRCWRPGKGIESWFDLTEVKAAVLVERGRDQSVVGRPSSVPAVADRGSASRRIGLVVEGCANDPSRVMRSQFS